MKRTGSAFLIFFMSLIPLMLTPRSGSASLFSTEMEIIPVHEGESIQAAIDKARPGAVVLVSSGVYLETVKLKEKVILRSESGPEQTTIDGSRGSGTVVQMAPGGTLDGFTVTGRVDTDKSEARHAIECVNMSAVIKNNVVRDNKGTGIYVSGKDASPVISGNRIYDNSGTGIGNSDYSKAQIKENACYGNGRSGIGVRKGAAPKVLKNKCFQNRNVGIGVRHKETAPLLEGNECYNNEKSGIGIQMGASATLADNYLHNNGRAGVGLRDASSAVIKGNTIQANTLSGIGTLDKSKITVTGNKISANVMSGITVMDGSEAVIDGNTIEANGTQGIVCSSARMVVKNNRVLNNTHHGISFYRDSEGEAFANVINNNGSNDRRGAGILVVSSNEPHIHHNEFNHNYGPGVYTRRCSPLIEENTFLNDLVFVKFHAAPTVRKNVFYAAGKSGGKTVKSGVDVRETSHPIIMDNEFYGKFGIAVRGESSPLIMGNKFSGSHKNSINSGRSGVKVDKTSRPTIVDNIFYNGNHLLIVGRKVHKNLIVTFRRTGQLRKLDANAGFRPEDHGGKTVIVAGNQFIDLYKSKGRKRGRRR